MGRDLKIGLIGASGKLGLAILKACFERKKNYHFELVAKNSIGQLNPTYKKPYLGIDQLKDVDLVLEVASQEAASSALEYCLFHNLPLIIGSTGHDPQFRESIHLASLKIPIFIAENFSLSLALYLQLIESIAPYAHEKCYIDLIEKHRALKKDTPSGTAKKIAESLQLPYHLGSPSGMRKEHGIHIHSIRGQDHPIEHTLMVGFENESIELKHQVFDRLAYAKGAIEAIEFIYLKPCGLYQMKDLAKAHINL